MTKIFKIPFATQGDRTAVPDEVQADGSLSYSQGYGYDYERDQATDPAAKDIEREKMNSIFHDITGAVGEIQAFGMPAWAEEGKPYAIRSIVYHNKKAWQSKIENNNTEPAAGAAWTELKADMTAGDVGAYTKGEADQKFQPLGNYLPAGYSYSKSESDTNFQPKGNYAPAGNYALKSDVYTKAEGDSRYQPKGNYQVAGYSYSKAESDANFQSKGNYAPADNYALKGDSYTKTEGDLRYQPKGNYYLFSEINEMPGRGFNGAFSGGIGVKYIKGISVSSGGQADTGQIFVDFNAVVTARYLNSNGSIRENRIVGVPIGATIEWQSAASIPEGFLENDGRSFSASDHPELAKIFPGLKLPDDRGLFKRGLDRGKNIDPGRALGSVQGDAMRNLTGRFGNPTIEGGDFSEGVFRHSVNIGGRAAGANGNSIAYSFDASRQVSTANEFRPVNKAVIYITRVI